MVHEDHENFNATAAIADLVAFGCPSSEHLAQVSA